MSAASGDPRLASPCTGTCTLDAERACCIGCRRTLDEIARWTVMDDAERRAVLDRIAPPARLRAR